ncbi:MAG: hypothetical protein BGO45_13015 [Microbacterium sp. 71-36]|uniref:Sec-independent protein translocase subunit TatA/TatB n=1 Tax=unclassified Microbacterium TaxID=2609290 RepID=UPI00086E40F5|nr:MULTISPECIES: twin-arginine translocase TatA/TatE family subunit [unclassified Microbacterium]MBN9211813.1 hypothetical protein [Microbacterium sp.]ODT37672.1 MAG: hypothetical protein ABS60_12485 [Microbacterium sp. SCN 71-17]OJV77662.1 MAG: hypothetical protein BGO45_13015 [Microbacterium sp. 71-36]
MFGMSLEKLVLVLLIAAVLIGPTRLPDYARRLSGVIRSARGQMDAATARLAQETGLPREHWNPEEWRRYDPREIVRSALRDAPAEATPPRSDATAPRDTTVDETASGTASDSPESDDPWAEVLCAPETLARIRPGQRFLVVGGSAHPTRITLADLPEDHPARRASAAVSPAETDLPAAPVADSSITDDPHTAECVGVGGPRESQERGH